LITQFGRGWPLRRQFLHPLCCTFLLSKRNTPLNLFFWFISAGWHYLSNRSHYEEGCTPRAWDETERKQQAMNAVAMPR
jgi:hypothetical protein